MQKKIQKILSNTELFLALISPRLMLKIRKVIGYGIEPELDLIKYFVNSNEIAIDIGANAGMYCEYMLEYTKKIYAFEPNPIYFRRLVRTFKNRALIYKAALSDSDGVAELRVPNGVNGAGTVESSNKFSDEFVHEEIKRYNVETKPLDSYHFPEGIGFIKIDVEGYEMTVLNGARKIIDINRPIMLIEIEERHKQGSIKNVFNYFEDREYKIYFYSNKKLITVDKFDAEINQKFGSSIPYINNFIFLPKEKINLEKIINKE
jgi:FkbM family methyltransferase